MVGSTIIKDPTSCPQCLKTSFGINEILRDFGLRNMDGTIRVQSWCKKCRSQSIGVEA